MKKTLIILLICLTLITGCNKKEENINDSLKFKESYESLNKDENYRSINISKENNIEYITGDELVEKIKNKESFYVYFGSTLCPWCRSVIESALEVSTNKHINKIYYVEIWDEDHNEILRDKYIINEEGNLELEYKGASCYKELLNSFDSLLSDYTLKDKEGNVISTGEKRIYAPSFIYIEKGEALRLTTGISSYQKDSKGELTKEILTDQKNKFDEFFINENNYCEEDKNC